MGQNGRFRTESVAPARLQLKRKLALFPVQDIFNSDEASVLCRSFPIHANRSTQRPATHERVKDRLTVICFVLADRRKGPLVIIGTSKRPRSFPRRFDALHDFFVFYQTQKDAWNTKNLWKITSNDYNNICALEGRTLLSVVENCSTYVIDYGKFGHWRNIFLPPNMTSCLQPVDAVIWRSFKREFPRLLFEHILKYVDKIMFFPSENFPQFILHEAVTTYDAVCIRVKGWNMFPNSVVINGLLEKTSER